MGDISESRGLITVGTFLGVLVLLIAWIPSEFYAAPSGRQIEAPDIFESIDIYFFSETATLQTNETGGENWWWDSNYYINDVDIGNWDINLFYRRAGTGSPKECWLIHVWYEWFIIPSDHRLEWFAKSGASQGEYLSVEEIEAGSFAASNNTVHSFFRAVCDHTTYHTTFGYNSSAYISFSDAWENQEMFMFFGVNFDDVNTATNAWHLIGMLLFFQLPNVNPLINAIIAIPIWLMIAYLTFILILRAIGAIFGGGA